MILTDREINAALDHHYVTITPRPSAEAFSSTTVDLTLSENFTEWAGNAGLMIRPGATGYKYTSLIGQQNSIQQAQYTLKPHSFVLAWTKEEVSIPIHSRLAARVEGKSSMARLGISVHVTAPTIHCGFEGPIQLEMFNFGPHEVILDAGMRICQLIFEQTLGTPEKGYQGIFLNQRPTKG